MEDKIQLEDITKTFGDITAVDDVTASCAEGTYTMILGPSGSGKSTLLRIIAGLEAPTEGRVMIDGEDVTDSSPQERDLSMVFQNLALWDHKSVRENIAFGLKMKGVGEDERTARVEEIAELLHIEEKLDANPTDLSGGQQQRVALGRSLVREPDVVLLDEPLASLDERLRLEMRTELKRIQQETGTTFIHVTHNQEDSMTVADEILLINDGQVQQSGPPLDLYHSPANVFVADFIGSPSMNIFDATFVDDGEVFFEVAGGARLDIPEGWEEHFRNRVAEGRVRVGVRPESVEFGGNEAPAVEGTVSIVETFGDYNWYYVDTPISDEFIVQSADSDVMETVTEGDQVTLSISPGSIHTFDPETGDAMGSAQQSSGQQSLAIDREGQDV